MFYGLHTSISYEIHTCVGSHEPRSCDLDGLVRKTPTLSIVPAPTFLLESALLGGCALIMVAMTEMMDENLANASLL